MAIHQYFNSVNILIKYLQIRFTEIESQNFFPTPLKIELLW